MDVILVGESDTRVHGQQKCCLRDSPPKHGAAACETVWEGNKCVCSTLGPFPASLSLWVCVFICVSVIFLCVLFRVPLLLLSLSHFSTDLQLHHTLFQALTLSYSGRPSFSSDDSPPLSLYLCLWFFYFLSSGKCWAIINRKPSVPDAEKRCSGSLIPIVKNILVILKDTYGFYSFFYFNSMKACWTKYFLLIYMSKKGKKSWEPTKLGH